MKSPIMDLVSKLTPINITLINYETHISLKNYFNIINSSKWVIMADNRNKSIYGNDTKLQERF